MVEEERLNPLARRVCDTLLVDHPEWACHIGRRGDDDLEVVVPAPKGSHAKHLVIFTSEGKDIWIRYAPPRMAYAVESLSHMSAVARALLADQAFFLVITDGDEWVETTLLRPGEEPVLGEHQVATIVSWSGKSDSIIAYAPGGRPRG
jgi:hypothetical protein